MTNLERIPACCQQLHSILRTQTSGKTATFNKARLITKQSLIRHHTNYNCLCLRKLGHQQITQQINLKFLKLICMAINSYMYLVKWNNIFTLKLECFLISFYIALLSKEIYIVKKWWWQFSPKSIFGIFQLGCADWINILEFSRRIIFFMITCICLNENIKWELHVVHISAWKISFKLY